MNIRSIRGSKYPSHSWFKLPLAEILPRADLWFVPNQKDMKFDVLPPEKDRDTPDLSRLLAWVLDDLVRIPGTNFRIGLDPIIGLIPGLGDGSTAVLSSVIMLNAVRAGMPRVVLVRMALNILVNTLFGAVPVLGDIFSAGFKSNKRNYELLRRHEGQGGKATKGDWAFVIGVLALVFIIVVGIAFAFAWAAVQFVKLLASA